ncbi:alpha/beta fold hydrolase [Sinorhizobium fredii]|uniref:alpha/beta fold hydrolase n=1 Tax=Rhizobium fredii TaxID=380 RepID=UPI0035129D25
MPYLDLASHRLHYRIDGDTHDSQSKPWLIFCNSLGTDLHMWDAQVAGLWQHFRMLRYDRRGHGLSSVPPPPYGLADFGNDVLALLDALQIRRAHFCGLSIGGLTGQWLGIHAGHRLGNIALCATSAQDRYGRKLDRAQRRRAGERTCDTDRRHRRTLVHSELQRSRTRHCRQGSRQFCRHVDRWVCRLLRGSGRSRPAGGYRTDCQSPACRFRR